MNFLNIRRKLFLKRKLLKFVGFRPKFRSTLDFGISSQVNLRNLDKYSPPTNVEIFDPRSNRTRSHLFEERRLIELSDVICHAHYGLVYTTEGYLISESTTWPDKFQYASFPLNIKRSCNYRKIDDSVSYTMLTSNSYGHWLIEDLGPFLYTIKKQEDLVVLVSKRRPQFVSDLLKHLKINYREVDEPVIVGKLLIVEKHFDSGWPHPFDIEVTRSLTNFKKDKSNRKRIYASRASTSRKPINEPELAAYFSTLGFEVMELDKFNFIDEIELIQNATALVGLHGSGLSNSIWMDSGSQVFEIVTEDYWTDHGHRIPWLMQHDYGYSLAGKENRGFIDVNKVIKDFTTYQNMRKN